MKRSLIIPVAIILVLAVGCAVGFALWNNHQEQAKNSLTVLDLSGKPLEDPEKLSEYPALETLDLRDTGMTIEQYEQVRSLVPQCEILWRVPFQGQYLDADTEALVITTLSAEDLDALAYFPQLTKVDAMACEELDMIAQLQTRYPECNVAYQGMVCDQLLTGDTAEATFTDADADAMMESLIYFPHLEKVIFAGTQPEQEKILALREACPWVDFVWNFTVCGVEVSSEDSQIDLSGILMDSVEEVENSLSYFNHLEKVIMHECGISSQEMDALWKRHPETRFVWTVHVGKMALPTDTTALMPFKYGYTGADKNTRLYDKDCGEMKYLVDMVCMDLGHMWVNDISFVRHMPNLEYLLLCGNGIQDISPLAGLQKLKYVELFTNPFTDISPLAECPALEDVNLSYIKTTDIEPLLKLKNIKNLWMYSKSLTEEQMQQLQDAFPDAKIVFHVGRSTGYGWRELPNYFKQRDLLGMFYMVTNG